MILRCVVSYITPAEDVPTLNFGHVVHYFAGELYEVPAELGLWLLAAAEGQFAVVDTETQDLASLQGPPAERQVSQAPAGGAPRSRNFGGAPKRGR